MLHEIFHHINFISPTREIIFKCFFSVCISILFFFFISNEVWLVRYSNYVLVKHHRYGQSMTAFGKCLLNTGFSSSEYEILAYCVNRGGLKTVTQRGETILFVLIGMSSYLATQFLLSWA